MSMLDGFFNKGFKGARCKTLLKLTIPRIKLLRNRRENQLRLMRRDIAKLLENGQEATARIRVEHIIREENINAAQEIIELFCELIAVRLPIIETQRECPIDLKEAISSICFAAPRSADLPELQQVQMLFAAKYGKEFVAAASELMPDCGVNRQIIELLSVRAPSAEAKLKLLKEIAEEHELDWDPAASETEFFKPHEDLLNGPNHFVSGSTLPLPKEKYDDSLSSNRRKESDEESDTDVGLDSLDLPEVPRVSVRPSLDTAPEIHPHQPLEPDHEVTMSPTHKDLSHIPDVTMLPPHKDLSHIPDHKDLSHIPDVTMLPPHKDLSHIPDVEPTPDGSNPLPYLYTPDAPFPVREHKHSVHLSPSPSPDVGLDPLPYLYTPDAPFPVREHKHSVHLSPSPSPDSVPSQMKQSESENSSDLPSVPSVSPTLSWKKSFAGVDAPPMTAVSFSPKHNMPGVPDRITPQTKNSVNTDLQDVLAAAHAAADSAERAAAAARAAASLAQVRITELISKRSNITPDASGDVFEGENSSLNHGDAVFDQQNSFTHVKQIPDYEPAWSSGSPTLASDDVPEHQSPHRPERLPSLEDDPYYSYPNLFSSQGGERQIR